MKIVRNMRDFYEYSDCEKNYIVNLYIPGFGLSWYKLGSNANNVPYLFSHTFPYYLFNQT